jgi:hypothetical protein
MLKLPRVQATVKASLARRMYASTTVQLPKEAHGHLPTSQSPITSKLHFFNSVMEEGKQIPTYRVLDGTGKLIEGAHLPEVSLHIWHEGPIERLLTGLRWTKLLHGRCKFIRREHCVFLMAIFLGTKICRDFRLSTTSCIMFSDRGRSHFT